jgi:tetratricopeptide (TPR) repeat protein
MNKVNTLLILFLFISRLCHASIQPNGSPSRLEIGDEAFRNRTDQAKAELALQSYREDAAATEQKDAQSLWRVSMGCYYVGLKFVKAPSLQEKIFAEGRDAGLRAAELDPKCASCRFWAAINMALYGQTVGVFKMLFSLAKIQDLLKQSIALDPKYAYSGAQRLLGLIYEKIPGIIGGNNDLARNYFQEAINVSPDEPMNYLNLAQLQLNEFHEPKSALATVQRGLMANEVSPLSSDRVESREALNQLKEIETNLLKVSVVTARDRKVTAN